MNLTEEQIRAILACSGFELVAFEANAQPDRHALQCDCDACLNGTREETEQ